MVKLSTYPKYYRDDSNLFIEYSNGQEGKYSIYNGNKQQICVAYYINKIVEETLYALKNDLKTIFDSEIVDDLLFEELRKQYYRALMQKGKYDEPADC